MAAPNVAAASALVLNKLCRRPATSSIVEETQKASSSKSRFRKDYIPPRNPSTKEVHLQRDTKYPLIESPIPKGVIVEGDMLGMIPTLKYVDHDITDEKKYPDLVPNKFLRKYISDETHMIVIEPQVWATGLQKEGLLNLFDIPHFGQIQEINACVKILLSCVHGGYMWLNMRVSIDIYLIVCIISLSS